MKHYFLGILAVSLLVNAFFAFQTLRAPADKSQQFPYLSKRIFAENQNDILINFIPLRTALHEYVNKQDDEIGVYFEYLPSGISIAANDKLEGKLASLIKIPLVMGVYKQIENGKLKKEDILTVKKENLDKRFGALWQKGEGHKLTTEEAVHLTLVDSDNTASSVLLSAIPNTLLDHIFDSLDVPKDKEGKFHIISPKSYSSILRSLYLSSYLSETSSNQILTILTQTKFNDKIPAGIPRETKIAHKIGVFSTKDDPRETYSDCGIVYVPNRPYILCIMVKSSEDKAREYMQLLSKMVYGYVIKAGGGQ
ncbi:serine hydrolase [Candidatus Uhrbacteria bacterium]|nr:serine hydrolase [Candidatus Uhrbacteria bacterium]